MSTRTPGSKRDTLPARLAEAMADRYTLHGELPRGGMARVFRATERALGREVVLKVLPGELSGAVESDRFEREIQLAASIPHPHIVPVLAAGDFDGVPWYAMPFIDGPSLRKRLEQQGQLALPALLRMLRELASALVAAHGAGVVHRDIKPENILFAGDAAMVTDFGVAKALRSAARDEDARTTISRAGFVVGTPAYMAPEQAAGEPMLDGQVDVYAFGCVAFEALTGRTPFTASNVAGMMAAQVSKPVPDLAALAPDAPRALVRLIVRCLAKAPADRPQGGAEIVSEIDTLLEQATAGASRPATPPPPTPHLWHGHRRTAVLAAVLLTLALIALCGPRGG